MLSKPVNSESIQQSIEVLQELFIEHHPLNQACNQNLTEEQWQVIAEVSALDGFF